MACPLGILLSTPPVIVCFYLICQVGVIMAACDVFKDTEPVVRVSGAGFSRERLKAILND